MSSFQIAHRSVGPNEPPLVIAEIGINHSGSLEIAMEMVDSAKRAGAEIIKHQTHIVGDEMSDAAKNVIPGNADTSIFEIMRSCALSSEDELKLKEYVEAAGMIFLSTPFSRAAANFLADIGVEAFKIGSGECNNYPLISHICKFGKPIILSTGMNSIPTIQPAVEIMRSKKIPFALLHCTNLYPTPHRLVRLGAMSQLAAAFPDAVVGLSDHTVNNNACLGAVALGASLLERHFTDTKQRQGPDIVCSMDEAELAMLIEGANEIWQCRGGTKAPAAEEQVTMDFAFATVVTVRDIAEGECFTEANIWVKRPGTGGIPAKDYERVLGQKAVRRLATGLHLNWEDTVR